MLEVRRSKQKGQTIVEYGLLIALISVVAIVVLVLLGPRIAGHFQYLDEQLVNAQAAP